MNVTLKYMPQSKKAKECTGYMAMKLDIRKGSPAGLAAETGCHMCSWAERLKLRRPNWPGNLSWTLVRVAADQLGAAATCAQLVSEARNGRLNWGDK